MVPTMQENYSGPERRAQYSLSDQDVERVALRAKELAMEELYISVGRSVITKGLWFVGLVAAGVAAYLGATGHFSKVP